MNIREFVFQLHFDIDKVKPVTWEPDWEDAPVPFKLYRGTKYVPLSSDIPLTLEPGADRLLPGVRGIGHFLWYVFGLAQMARTALPEEWPPRFEWLTGGYRRPIPSGGGLYPNEVYAYLPESELPAGIYHYDAAHHRLTLLREGHFDPYIRMAVGDPEGSVYRHGVLFVSVLYWKNFFKYNYFSYRLQGLDSGVVLGQLLEAAKRFGYAPAVHYQFLDRAVNHLLGLPESYETVYAVVPLSGAGMGNLGTTGPYRNGQPALSADALCRMIPPVRHRFHLRSRRIRDYPLLLQMNAAARQESTAAFRRSFETDKPGARARSIVPLPPAGRLAYDFALVSRNRPSPETDFVMKRIRLEQLAALLQETSASFRYRNDWDALADSEAAPRVHLFGSFYGVEGLEDGAYRYDGRQHGLVPLRPGDHRTWLQYAMSLHNVNLFQVPVCLHIAGNRHHELPGMGARGYRMQQMEAGMLTQRVLLAAAALGMGGRPLLGFDTCLCDRLYGLEHQGLTTLIQIPVGHYRRRGRYEAGLHG